MPELTKGLLVLEDGSVYSLPFSRLSPKQVDEALRKVADSGYQKVVGAMKIDGEPVTLCVNANQVIAGVPLKRLNLLAKCQLIDGHMVPVFTGDEVFLMNCVWTPPANCQMHFAMSLNKSGATWKISNVFLFCRAASGTPGGFFKLPLPNIYPDGRVCMGERFQMTCPENTIEGLLKHGIRHLAESPWGTDMMPQASKIRALFRFDPGTLTSVEPATEWHTHCDRVSRVEMDALFS